MVCAFLSRFSGLRKGYAIKATLTSKWTLNQSSLCLTTGLSGEKVSAFIKRLRSEPRYLLAQNVSTCIDPLEVCLHRQTVQDTVHVFQHAIPAEGKPVTNQKNSGNRTQSKITELYWELGHGQLGKIIFHITIILLYIIFLLFFLITKKISYMILFIFLQLDRIYSCPLIVFLFDSILGV